VMERGALTDCHNPSSAVVGRIRDARRLSAAGSAGAQGTITVSSDAVEVFLAENGIDDKAANTLRGEPPQVQQLVLDRGPLSDCTNPSSALVSRIREARSVPKLGPGAAAVTSHEVEHFLAASNIDERAAQTLRNELPHIQRMVIDRGTFDDCSNPSSALVGRIRDAKKQLPQLAAMATASSHMHVDAQTMEDFIYSNGIDDRAAQTLRNSAPAIQQAVLERGPLTEANNPSSAVVGRIRDAKAKVVAAQTGGTDMMGGAMGSSMGCAGGCGGGGAGIGAYVAGAMGDLQQQMQMMQSQMMQMQQQLLTAQVMPQQNLQQMQQNMQRMQQNMMKVQGGGGGGGGGGAGGYGGGCGGGMANQVEQFLLQNQIDERCAASFRGLPSNLQQTIMARGGLADCSNPSSALVGRIRDAKNGGMSGGHRASPY